MKHRAKIFPKKYSQKLEIILKLSQIILTLLQSYCRKLLPAGTGTLTPKHTLRTTAEHQAEQNPRNTGQVATCGSIPGRFSYLPKAWSSSFLIFIPQHKDFGVSVLTAPLQQEKKG